MPALLSFPGPSSDAPGVPRCAGLKYNGDMKRSALRLTPRQIATGAAIAALYVVLTALFAPISFGNGAVLGVPGVQFRISEVLVLLPVFTTAAVPGVALGCFLSNLLFGGLGLIDVVFGTLATLLGAFGTRLLRRWPPLAPLPPILLNAFVVGTYLAYILPAEFRLPLWLSIASVGVGEIAVLYILGLPVLYVLKRVSDRVRLFPEDR